MNKCRALILVLFLKPAMAHAQADILVPQFQANTYTELGQEIPALAVGDAGDFLVVWTSAGSAGSDQSGRSVQGQMFHLDGMPSGGEFQINAYTTSTQQSPTVATDGGGRYVVVWEGVGLGDDTQGIFGRILGPGGVPIGDEFQVNTYTPGTQNQPEVVMGSAGSFVVAWTSTDPYLPDSEILARRFDSSGAPTSGAFQVNTYTTGFQSQPALSMSAAGDFVVVWSSNSSTGDSDYTVLGQAFNANGGPIGEEFQANTYTSDTQSTPSVGMDALGNFTVAWESQGSFGDDNLQLSIQARRFNASAVALGPEFQVNTYTTTTQNRPFVAMDSAGQALIVWESHGPASCDNSGAGVYGLLYDASGNEIGTQFIINEVTGTDQQFARAFLDESGEFTVVWDSRLSPGDDTSLESVQVTRQRASLVPGSCGGGGGGGGGGGSPIDVPSLAHFGKLVFFVLLWVSGFWAIHRRR